MDSNYDDCLFGDYAGIDYRLIYCWDTIRSISRKWNSFFVDDGSISVTRRIRVNLL